jgi:hypothetical protein
MTALLTSAASKQKQEEPKQTKQIFLDNALLRVERTARHAREQAVGSLARGFL